MKSKIMNSKAYQVFDYICRLIILNLLLIIISFSIFLIFINIYPNMESIYQMLLFIPSAVTVVPCIVAIAEVIKGYEIEKNNGVVKEFFKALKKHFKKSCLISVLLMVSILLISNSITFFSNMQDTNVIYVVGYALSLSIVLIMIICLVHLPLTMIYFDDLKIIHYIKLSLIFGFKDLGLTLLLTLFIVMTFVLCYLSGIYMVLIGFSLAIYLIVKLTKNKYLKISERNK